MEAAELPYSSNWVCVVLVLYTVQFGRTDAALPTGSTRTWIFSTSARVSLIVTFRTSPVVRSAVLQYSSIRGTFANVLDVVDKTSDFSKFVLPLVDR